MRKEQKVLEADKKCVPVQKMVFARTNPGQEVNSFAPRNTPGKHMREDGVIYLNDVCYGDQYPNSYLDIWYTSDEIGKRPTVIYIHGGGFIFGDKVTGDPLAQKEAGGGDFFGDLAKKGYNVVSPNYALSPEYRFPAQVDQVDQALRFLTKHQEEYGLDMENVFLGGGSAGACLSEIYGVALTNPEYGERIGVKPSIRPEQIRGLLIDEAALSTVHFEENMKAMLGCWMGVDELSKSPYADILNAAKWIGDTYFPSFINASNREIFFEDSARELKEILDQNGTDYDYVFWGREHDDLEHGYMQRYESNPYARECFERMLAFVEKYRK